jgi:aryl-alcohol dehydrogenase-like predicted oxidoreductase
VTCRTRAEAEHALRFVQCALTLHPDKTKVVYCKDDDRRGDYPDHRFDFLGYTFRPRLSRRWKGLLCTLRAASSFSDSKSNVGKAMEQSYQRLGMDRIDIALIHDVDIWTHGSAEL